MSEGGAPSFFIQEVLASAGKAEKEDINEKVEKLANQIADVKYEVYESLRSQYDDFIPNLTATLELSNQVKSISEDMQTLTDRIEKEIQMQLNMSTSEFQNLSSRLQESNGILEVLDKLVQVHDALQMTNRALKSKEFVVAAEYLEKTNKVLIGSEQTGQNEITILKALKTEYIVQKEKLPYDLGEAWNECVSWIIPQVIEGERITTLNVRNSADSRKMIGSVLQGMSIVNILTAKMKVFADRVMMHMIQPVLNCNQSNVTASEKSDLAVLATEHSTSKDKDASKPADAFAKIGEILKFINKNIFSCIPSGANERHSAIKVFGDLLSRQLLDSLIADCLSSSIPSSSEDLPGYEAVVKLTVEFEDGLRKMGIISEECSTLTDYVNNVNVLFANKKCQELLEKARSLMSSEIHNMIKVSETDCNIVGSSVELNSSKAKKAKNVDENCTSNSTLSTCLFKLPEFYISDWVQELMQLAYSTLHEACAGCTENCAIQLFYSVRNMFDMYCCVVPAFHKQSLETLPQQSALHHNNCMYIAHHLTVLGHQFATKLPKLLQDCNPTFVDFVPKIRQLGVDYFQAQMTRQRNQMFEYLQAAQGFVNASDMNYEDCERAIKQVLFQLSHLQKVWQPVLPEKMYRKSMAILLNSVIVHIISSLTSLEDISADDASQLFSLLNNISGKAPSFFQTTEKDQAEAMASLQKYAPKWMKFKEIIALLDSGLVEVTDRWADGKGPLANECSPSEVRQLVRALFQNTEVRASVLMKIK
ncbi:centromere/kinetochore protein zw10 homolog [Tubulanus polymorphus]|uniref:centromere/kinetochore protein zw10 homolog n=1 Tax=Tubulanus polymorphus TaxID=672921 RepID=UPI003DA5CFCE